MLNKYYEPRHFLASGVPGSLTEYDITDLEASIAPRNLILVNLVDELGNFLDVDDARQRLTIVNRSYKRSNRLNKFEILSWPYYRNYERELYDIERIFSSWLQ